MLFAQFARECLLCVTISSVNSFDVILRLTEVSDASSLQYACPALYIGKPNGQLYFSLAVGLQRGYHRARQRGMVDIYLEAKLQQFAIRVWHLSQYLQLQPSHLF